MERKYPDNWEVLCYLEKVWELGIRKTDNMRNRKETLDVPMSVTQMPALDLQPLHGISWVPGLPRQQNTPLGSPLINLTFSR